MNKADILSSLKTLKTNMEVTLPEIAKYLGLESLLITDDQRAELEKMNAIKKLSGDAEPVSFVKELVTQAKANAEAVRAAKFNEVFGPREFADTKKANKARLYAEKVIGNEELTEEKINSIKEDEIYKALAAERADYNSDVNQIGESVGRKENAGDGPVVVDY